MKFERKRVKMVRDYRAADVNPQGITAAKPSLYKAGEVYDLYEGLASDLCNLGAAKWFDVEDQPAEEIEPAESVSFDDMSIKELKTLCRERGLKVSGPKADLVERLSKAPEDTESEDESNNPSDLEQEFDEESESE